MRLLYTEWIIINFYLLTFGPVINNRMDSHRTVAPRIFFYWETDLIKIRKFTLILWIINNIFKPEPIQKSTTLEVYNIVALSIILYGTEFWTIRGNKETYQYRKERKLNSLGGEHIYFNKYETRYFRKDRIRISRRQY